MLMTITPLMPSNDAGHPHPHPPPPLLPKPGKENIRLQKVLQKAAKKKNPPAAVAQPKAFRSTLSPVSEASPDLEHCERTPPPHPTTPRPVTPRPVTPRPVTPSFLGLSLPPRFIKPVVHHVSSPYPQHRPFTFTVTEQRSLSECLRRTPSPRPPSPSVQQVIPPLQLQQPPKRKTDGPRQVLVPASPAHLPHPIPVIMEPPAACVRTPAPCTPVVEVMVKEVYVNDVQALLPETESLKEGRAMSECVQKTTNRKEDQNSMLCQSDSSSMVSTTVTTLHITTNAPLPKTTQDAASTNPPKNEPTMESAQEPKTPSIQLSTPSTSKDNIRPLTPKQQDILTTHNDAQTVQVTITSHNSISVAKTEVLPASPVLPAKSETTISEVPKSEPLLKPAEKVKPPRTKLSGWSRLKKHLVVEPEEPKFPVPESEAPRHVEGAAEEENKGGKDGEDKSLDNKTSKPKESRANKMWDALLYQMSSPKEEDKRKEDKEATGEKKPSAKEEKPSFFRCRLPLLLYRPRFDARKLREAASRPFKKITTMFDLGRLNRKDAEEEPKDFNRTASGWQIK